MIGNEIEEAKELAKNRKRLKSRLQSAVGALRNDLAKKFKGATFDFEKQRLVSSCGEWALQYKPEDTRMGIVLACQLKGEITNESVLAKGDHDGQFAGVAPTGDRDC